MSLDWYGELSKTEKRTFWACFGGYTLDSLASTMYALTAPVLIAVMGFTKPEIGALTTAGLIGNCLGGWIAGIIADRFGRMTLLTATVLWVALFSALAAISTSHAEFFAVRFLQGLGFGGEAAVAGVLISEVVRPHLRGRTVAAVQSGYGFGFALSTLLMPVVFACFPEAIAWRVLFGIGLVPALLVLYIRRYVPESHAFEAADARRRQGHRATPFWAIFDRSNVRGTLFGLLLAAGALGGGFGIHQWLPTYLRLALHLKVASTSGYLVASILGLLIGPIAGGMISDLLGRRPTFLVLLAIDAAVVSALLFLRPTHVVEVFGLIFLQGAVQGGVNACLVPTFSELFRTDIRASGAGFCITGGRGIGSIGTSVVGVLATTMPLGHAMGACALTLFALAAVAVLFLPPMQDVDLEAFEGVSEHV